jgi:hypothetical protein
MGRISDEVQQGKLYFSLLASSESVLSDMREILGRQYSHIDIESPIMESEDGAFYMEEMGDRILRQWVSAHNLFFVPQLVEIKRSTHKLELKTSEMGKRTINIDPGYLTANKVIRATSRDAAHRLYMNRGIFVESVLMAEDARSFSPWPWTDADFRSDLAGDFFQRVREVFLRQINQARAEEA